MVQLSKQHVSTPVGRFTFYVDDGAVVASHWSDRDPMHNRFMARFFPDAEVRAQGASRFIAQSLERYFAGEMSNVQEIPIKLHGTAFQRQVWSELLAIAPGKTVAYTDIATAIGRPTAFRAVAQANRANPISVIVPCHRVIGKDGSLTGYSGNTPAGLRLKAWLIELEKQQIRVNAPVPGGLVHA